MKDTPVFYRRRLPHWQPENAVLFVTFRLAGSLPAHVIAALREDKERLLKEAAHPDETDSDKRTRVDKTVFGLLDKALVEQSSGPFWLSDTRVAGVVQQSMKFWDTKRYLLHRYVIMPNHVHLLIQPVVRTVSPHVRTRGLTDRATDPDNPIVVRTVSPHVRTRGLTDRATDPDNPIVGRTVSPPSGTRGLTDRATDPANPDVGRTVSPPCGTRGLTDRATEAGNPVVGRTVSPPCGMRGLTDRATPEVRDMPEEEIITECYPLPTILRSLKGFTGHRANEILDRTGHFWDDERYDHWVRDDAECVRIANYIDANPIKGGLCKTAEEWPWSTMGELAACAL